MHLAGSIRVPSDKSISHRAVLFSGMATGVSRLENVLPSDDVLCSIEAMKALGVKVDTEAAKSGLNLALEGFGGTPKTEGPLEIDCGNSGTSARLLMGILSGLEVEACLVGDASLSTRPMQRVINPLQQMGASISSESGHLPVRIHPASGLCGIEYTTRQASAQLKSAILLAGCSAQGTTTVIEPTASRDHTERLLPAFGVQVETSRLTASVTGPTTLVSHDMSVPGDPSSAAFIAVAASLIPDSDVLIKEVSLNETRIGALFALQRMGCELVYENEHMEGTEPVGDVRVRYSPNLQAVTVEGADIPSLIDEIPILALAAAAACGETVFKSVGELRVKESDRLAAVIDALSQLGFEAFAQGDDLHIVGGGGTCPAAMPDTVSLATHHDHRLAMTFYLAGEIFGCDVALDDAECVSVSWPSFFKDYFSLVA